MRLTQKVEPPPTHDVNPDLSGNGSPIRLHSEASVGQDGGWLRLARRLDHVIQSAITETTPLPLGQAMSNYHRVIH